MSYTYGFFDAVDLGSGNYDRVYSSAEFSHYWALLVGDGVFGQPSTSLNILATTPVAMSVKVSPGTGWIKGHYLTVPDNMDEVIAVPVANPSLPRIDSIIMALDNTDRMMKLYVRSGTAAASPTAVTLQRDADIWELELAQVTVAAGAGNITQTAIKDMRTDPNRCGIVTGLIDQFDVSGFLTAAQASFDEWFEDVQSQLGDDVAGNLLNLINGLDTKIEGLNTELQETNNSIQETNSSLQELNTKVSNQAGLVKNSLNVLKAYSPLIKILNVSQNKDFSGSYGGYLSPDRKKVVWFDGSNLRLFSTSDPKLSIKSTVSVSGLGINQVVVFNDLILALTPGGTIKVYRMTDSSITLAKTESGLGWSSVSQNNTWYISEDDDQWALFAVMSSSSQGLVYKVNKSTLDISQVGTTYKHSWYNNIHYLPIGDEILVGHFGATGSGTGYYLKLYQLNSSGTKYTIFETTHGSTSVNMGTISYDPSTKKAYVGTVVGNTYYLNTIDTVAHTRKQVTCSVSTLGLWVYNGKVFASTTQELDPDSGQVIPSTVAEAAKNFRFQQTYGFTADQVYDNLFGEMVNSLLVGINQGYYINQIFSGTFVELGGVLV